METKFDRFVAKSMTGIFGVLFTMAKDTSAHRKWSIFGMWFDYLQLLAYSLYSGSFFPWYNMPVMTGLINVLSYLSVSNVADKVNPLFKLSLLFASAAWIAATVAAVVYSAYGFAAGNFTTVLPLKFLRATARLTVVLFVPLTSFLVSVYKCSSGDTWGVTGWQCYGLEHSIVVFIVSVLLPCFLLFSLVVSSVFLDRNYKSSNITARAHGRVGIAMISLKMLITVIFTVAGSSSNPWFMHFCVISLGFVWLYLWLRFLPCYTPWVNQAWAAFGATFLWAGLCGALARLLNDPADGVAGYVFYIGVATSAFAGYALASHRWASFARAAGQRVGSAYLRTPWDVELRARYLMKDFMAEEAALAHHGGVAGVAQTARRARRGRLGASHRIAPIDYSGDGGGGGGRGGSARVFRNDETHALHDADDNLDEDALAAKLREQAIDEAIDLFHEAHLYFPGSAVLGMLYANFVRVWLEDRELEVAIITAAMGNSPPMDVRFLLLQARKQLEEGASGGGSTDGHGYARVQNTAARGASSATGGIGSGAGGTFAHQLRATPIDAVAKTAASAAAAAAAAAASESSGTTKNMSIIDRVQFDKLMADTIEWGVKARTGELQFWSELRAPQPQLGRLHKLSTDMSTAITRTTFAFDKLLEMRKDSVEVLQSYAVFLTEVKREQDAAENLFSLADDLLRQREELRVVATAAAEHAAATAATHSGTASAAGDAAAMDPFFARPRSSSPAASDGLLQQSNQQHQELQERYQQHAMGPRRWSDIKAAVIAAAHQMQHPESASSESNHAAAHSVIDDVASWSPAMSNSAPAAEATAAIDDADWTGTVMTDECNDDPGAVLLRPMSGASRAGRPTRSSRAKEQGLQQQKRSPSEAAHLPLPTHPHRPVSSADAPFDTRDAAPSRRGSGVDGDAAGSAATGDAAGSAATQSGAHNADSRGGAAVGGPPHIKSFASLVQVLTTQQHGSSGGVQGDHKPGEHDIAGAMMQNKHRRGSVALAAYAAQVAIKRRASLGSPQLLTTLSGPTTTTQRGALSSPNMGGARQQQEQERSTARRTPNKVVVDDGVGSGSGRGGGLPSPRPPSASTPRMLAANAAKALAAKRRQRRKDNATEAAASSLRDSIKAQAAVMEPSLVLLLRALTALFLLVAAGNITLVALQRSYTETYAATALSVTMATARQLAVENAIHHTHLLTLMSGRLVPFTEDDRNNTLNELRGFAAVFSAAHLQLMQGAMSNGAGGGLPDELTLYNNAVLHIRTLSLVNPDGSIVVASSKESLSDMGLEFVSQANLVFTTSPRDNITASQSSAWYILSNGPGAIRDALNTSTILLNERAEAQANTMGVFNIALTGTAALCFGLLSFIVVLPIVRTVKRHTDDIFSVFLHLPDAILTAMQMNCANQIKELRAMFGDAESFQALAGPGVNIEQLLLTAHARTGGAVAAAARQQHDSVDVAVAPTATATTTTNDSLDGDDDAGGEGGGGGGSVLSMDHTGRMTLIPLGPDGKQLHLWVDDSPQRPSSPEARFSTPDGNATIAAARRRGGSDAPGDAGVGVETATQLSAVASAVAVKLMMSQRHLAIGDGGGGASSAGAATESLRRFASSGSDINNSSGKSSLIGAGRLLLKSSMKSSSDSGGDTPTAAGVAASVDAPVGDVNSSATDTLSRTARLLRQGGRSLRALAGPIMVVTAGDAQHDAEAQGSSIFAAARTSAQSSQSAVSRSFTQSHVMQLRLLLRFVWPLASFLIFYAAAFAYSNRTLASVADVQRHVILLNQLQFSALLPNQAIRSVLTEGAVPATTIGGLGAWSGLGESSYASPSSDDAGTSGGASIMNSWFGTGCNASIVGAVLSTSSDWATVMARWDDEALYGDEATGLSAALRMDPKFRALQLETACTAPGMPQPCDGPGAPLNGLLGNGLQPSFIEYTQSATRVLQRRIAALRSTVVQGAGCPPMSLSLGSDVWSLDLLAHDFLQPAFSYAVVLISALISDIVSAFETGLTALTAVSLLALLLLYLGVLRRNILRMDGDIKRTRGTLLMFPSDVLAGVAEFIEAAGGRDKGGDGDGGSTLLYGSGSMILERRRD